MNKKKLKRGKPLENWAASALYLTALSSVVVYLIIQFLHVMNIG